LAFVSHTWNKNSPGTPKIKIFLLYIALFQVNKNYREKSDENRKEIKIFKEKIGWFKSEKNFELVLGKVLETGNLK
jgi:hypothetical protein